MLPSTILILMRALVFFYTGVDGAQVSCGGHKEKTCYACPRGHGASYCNGDCKWDYSSSRCIKKGQTSGNAECLKHHPYAYLSGKYCCRTAEDCNGRTLTISSSCCENGSYRQCSGSKCKNYHGRRPSTGGCANKHNQCDNWKSGGYCESHPNWMGTNCKKSCGLCGNGGPDPNSQGRWGSIVKSYVSSKRQDSGTNLCKSMDEFYAVSLINAINAERTKKRLNTIPASNDMCATALIKGLVQKATNEWGATHDFNQRGVDAVLGMKRNNRWKLPAKLTSSVGPEGIWTKPDEILGRSLIGGCYGCPKTSSGFENAFGGQAGGRGSCSRGKNDLVQEAVNGWMNSQGHRGVMLNEGQWASRKWTRLGAAIMTSCENKGTNNEQFHYWANSWFNDL